MPAQRLCGCSDRCLGVKANYEPGSTVFILALNMEFLIFPSRDSAMGESFIARVEFEPIHCG